METFFWWSPGAQAMVHNDPCGGWLRRSLWQQLGVRQEPDSSQGRQANGPDAVLQSREQKSSILCSMLSMIFWKSQIITGGSWCGQTEWVLKARKVMPKFLITWAYHVQWLLLAHEIEPFSLLSAFPPQLGPQVAFSSVWKEESYFHLSKEFIKTQNMWPFKQG